MTAIDESAINRDRELSCACDDFASIAHADAGFGADQGDLAGIHAAEFVHIQGKSGRGAGACNRLDLRVVGADLVGAGDDLELLGVDRAIDLDGACKQRGVIRLAGIEPSATDGYCALTHVVPLNAAPIQVCLAGGECGTTGIDESAAVDINARRVGNDNLRPAAGHFNNAAQSAGITGYNFVENNLGGATSQPGIACDLTAERGGRAATRVVEDDAFFINVELAVGVARYASVTRRLNIDQRNAISGNEHGGSLVARRVAIGHHLSVCVGVNQANGRKQRNQHGLRPPQGG